MATPSSVSEALGIAIRMEQEGQKFYADAAARMEHPFGRRMFESLVSDEKRHERVFREMAEKRGVRPASASEIDPRGPAVRVSAIFRSMADKLSATVRPSDDDIVVLRQAMELERAAFEFYSDTSRLTANSVEKEILRDIAGEENEHYRILDDTLLYLTNPTEWHLKEEHPLIDGG